MSAILIDSLELESGPDCRDVFRRKKNVDIWVNRQSMDGDAELHDSLILIIARMDKVVKRELPASTYLYNRAFTLAFISLPHHLLTPPQLPQRCALPSPSPLTSNMDAYPALALLCTVLAISIAFFRCWTIDIAFANGLPWADLRNEVFKTTRASLRQLANCTQVLEDAYTKVSPYVS